MQFAEQRAVAPLGQRQFEPQDALPLGAPQGEHAAGGDAPDRLGEVEQALLTGCGTAVRIDRRGAQDATPQLVAHAGAGVRILGDAVGEDHERAFEHRFGSVEAGIGGQILGGDRLQRLVAQLAVLEREGQRQQTLLLHLHGAAAPPRAHRLVDVVEQVLIDGIRQGRLQLGGTTTAFLGLLQDALPPLLDLGQRVQAFGDRLQALLRQVADLPAAIAGNEGRRGLRFEQVDDGADDLRRTVELGEQTIERGLRCHGGCRPCRPRRGE